MLPSFRPKPKQPPIFVSFTLAICLLTLAAGCQSRRQQREPLPSLTNTSEFFSTCGKKEGEAHVKFEDLQFTFDWISRSESLQLEAYDPLGRRIKSIILEHTKGTLKDQPETDLSKRVKVDEGGFLSYSDSLIPLRFDELHCLLEAKLPLEWLDNASYKGKSNPNTILGVTEADTHRKTLVIRQVGPRIQKACVVIRWNTFLFFGRRTLNICKPSKAGKLYVDYERFRLAITSL